MSVTNLQLLVENVLLTTSVHFYLHRHILKVWTNWYLDLSNKITTKTTTFNSFKSPVSFVVQAWNHESSVQSLLVAEDSKSSSSMPGFGVNLPQAWLVQWESRFRKLEACSLQLFELCHWRQHTHKVDCCPSPEVFPCQEACWAQHRWIETLSASLTGPFVWVFGKPEDSPGQKKKVKKILLYFHCGTGQKAVYFCFVFFIVRLEKTLLLCSNMDVFFTELEPSHHCVLNNCQTSV